LGELLNQFKADPELGIVVLAYRDGGGYVVVKQMDIAGVMEALKGIPPRSGEWGEYWWFYSNGTPQGSRGTSYTYACPLEEPPF
jgi:hypothetical protein